MSEITVDEAEEQITKILTNKMGYLQPHPVMNDSYKVVGSAYPFVNILRIINKNDYPNLFEVICDRVLVLREGTRLRIFDKLDQALSFLNGLSGPSTICPGPSRRILTLEQLENPDEEIE